MSSYGDPASPSYYSQITGPIKTSDNIVTGFNSWLDNADLGTTYGSNFANEEGNRVMFGFEIDGNGSQFSISELGSAAVASPYYPPNPGDTFGWPANGGPAFGPGLGTCNYSDGYVGITYGSGGKADVANYTYITSGAATQPVDEIVSRGSRDAYAVYIANSGATNQDKINNFVSTLGGFDFTGAFYLTDSSGEQIATGGATVQEVTPRAFLLSGIRLHRPRVAWPRVAREEA